MVTEIRSTPWVLFLCACISACAVKTREVQVEEATGTNTSPSNEGDSGPKHSRSAGKADAGPSEPSDAMDDTPSDATGDAAGDAGIEGDGGGDAAVDASAPDAGHSTSECQPDDRRCDGLRPQTCNHNGQWQSSGTACSHACSAGSCISPTNQCGDGVVSGGETCDGDCPASCDDANACTGDARTNAPRAAMSAVRM